EAQEAIDAQQRVAAAGRAARRKIPSQKAESVVVERVRPNRAGAVDRRLGEGGGVAVVRRAVDEVLGSFSDIVNRATIRGGATASERHGHCPNQPPDADERAR